MVLPGGGAACALFLLLTISSAGGASQHLSKNSITPIVVQDGANQSVVLNCNYTLSAGDKLLHVKWLHVNSGHSQVYQWIKSLAPQDLGLLKHRVNLTYQASEDDNERYRALQILRPTVNLSGVYICRATSQNRTTERKQRLIVYSPPRQMSLYYTRRGADLVNVTCHMEGVYPEPQVRLERGHNAHSMVPIDAIQKYVSWQDGLYSLTVFWVTRDEFLFEQTVFVCLMNIPNTGHRERRQITYPGSDHLGPPEAAVSAKGGFNSSPADRRSTPFCTILPLLPLIGLGLNRELHLS